MINREGFFGSKWPSISALVSKPGLTPGGAEPATGDVARRDDDVVVARAGDPGPKAERGQPASLGRVGHDVCLPDDDEAPAGSPDGLDLVGPECDDIAPGRRVELRPTTGPY